MDVDGNDLVLTVFFMAVTGKPSSPASPIHGSRFGALAICKELGSLGPVLGGLPATSGKMGWFLSNRDMSCSLFPTCSCCHDFIFCLWGRRLPACVLLIVLFVFVCSSSTSLPAIGDRESTYRHLRCMGQFHTPCERGPILLIRDLW